MSTISSAHIPPPSPTSSSPTKHLREDSDADTASQRSISLSSPTHSRRNSTSTNDPRQSFATHSSEGSYSARDSAGFAAETGSYAERSSPQQYETPLTSAVPSSVQGGDKVYSRFKPVKYPPSPPQIMKNRADDAVSISSFASTSSRKARPESLLITPAVNESLILGVALVDFNHLVGPRIEYHRGDIFEDEEVAKILPFLALPDGAHLSNEDYSYFHLVKPGPNPTTIFGISCNQQIPATSLLVKGPDVTRSTVQKAVVVLASKPVFGPIREKLRVVTTALFLQRDFSDASILDDFGVSLELSLRSQLTESGLYMGTSLRELVHTFRQRTLVLVKALMLQKRIMFFGYPVEKLCTYQYSLVSLLPGLLQTLDDCGSPPLANRAPTLTRPTSLRTSDHKSMMAFMGLPLDLFGKDALFQPYLPLQQLDMLKNTPSWLCGCTNSIITHQNEIDLLVNTETGAFEFRDPKLERSAGLTSADRKWMDDILQDVNETWDREASGRGGGMHQFKGSDDYLRTKFEEYISAALSCVKYRDFVSRGESGGVLITGGTGAQPNSVEDFNPLWIGEFRTTKAYEVWDRITDPLIFDLIEPRHPCTDRPSVVADIGLRLQEGIQDLKLEQQLAPAREAVARTLTVGSSNFFKAVEGVKGRWGFKLGGAVAPSGGTNTDGASRPSTPPVEVSKADIEDIDEGGLKTAIPHITPTSSTVSSSTKSRSQLRPFSLTSTNSLPIDSPPGSAINGNGTAHVPSPLSSIGASKPISAWSAGIGSFFSTAATAAKTGSATGIGRFSTVLRTPTTAEPTSLDDHSQLSATSAPQPASAKPGYPHGYAPVTPLSSDGMSSPPWGEEASPLFSGPMSGEVSPAGKGFADQPASIGSVLAKADAESRKVSIDTTPLR